jgi:hypothetical protein
VLVGITYGIQPYGRHTMGWTNPWVLAALLGGCAVLGLFCLVEAHVPEPMFRLNLCKIRAFTFGNIASLMAALGRGGLMFILIIRLQGIWLPAHQRGVGGGMSKVFSNSAMVLSIGLCFSLMISGLASALPETLMHGLTVNGVPHDAAQAHLIGHSFFPALISGPFSDGLGVAFSFAIAACLIAALASALRGGKYIHNDDEEETPANDSEPGAELVAEGVE